MGFATFRHGVHPDENKRATASLATERMRFVGEYVLPLSQHIGAPSKAVVRPGERVERGQLLASPGGFVSVALHAPVSGTIKAIELRPHPNGKLMESIVVETDAFSSQELAVRAKVNGDAAGSIAQRVQQGGIVGLGGAAFPAHVKLSVPEGKKVRFLILNGCECEPYLTCDHRVMVERPEAVLRGLRLLMGQLGVERGYIGIERNKPDAVARLQALAASEPDIEVIALEVKYPQGAEKMLIDAILKKEVPSGKLPLDLEIVVNNVGTAAAIADLVDEGAPLIERVVTVTGSGIKRPANVLVPIGTPIRAVIEHCGGLLPGTKQVILGGPMMGQAQKNLDVPVTKGTSGILCLIDPLPAIAEEACIRCGRCLEACPMFLNPSRLQALIRREDDTGLKAYHVLDCIECASCSFVCPSHIPLVQLIRVGKALVRQKEKR
jgi:electron transport complex protein RnfC